MTEYGDSLQLRASGVGLPPCTLQQFQTLTHRYLCELRDIDARFYRLAVLGPDNFCPIKADFSDLEDLLVKSLAAREREFDAESYTHLGPSDTSRRGFSAIFYSYADEPTKSHVPIKNGGLELAIDGAALNGGGGVSLTLPKEFCDASAAKECLTRLIGATVQNWPYQFVSVGTQDFEKAVQQPGDLCSGQWLYFFPFDDLDSCLQGIQSQRFQAGTLVVTADHLPQASSFSDVAAGKRVREALDNLGLVWHSTYAIHGWPPDEEEWRYEEFISGAPRGRKYRVRCIDFDGYDAQRDVLLYAKLFRRLRHQRKEWGLRGWDGPVLNEARRQVRAANGTQIEWHVGLEEPASRVRTLLADYTDFNEAQLRVIYTPLSTTLSP